MNRELLVLASLLVGCTHTTLEVSPRSAANPQAPGATLPAAARSLGADFDPLQAPPPAAAAPLQPRAYAHEQH